MLDLDKWQEIFETIRKNKLRTFLTAFSVSWGIFMLIMLLGFGNGLQNGVQYTFRDDAINSLWISAGETSMAYKGLTPGREIRMKNKDYEMLRDNISEVEYITSRFYLGSEAYITYKNETATFDVRSVHPDHRYVENTLMIKGRFLNENDVEQYRKVVVLGSLVVEQLFPDEDPMGQYVSINGISFKVIGVFEDEGGESEQRKVYIPISTSQRAFNGQDRVQRVIFTTKSTDLETSKVTEASVKSLLSEKHQFHPDDPRAVRIRNNIETFARFNNLFRYIEMFVWFVGVLTIVAGIVGVGNIMTISVKERTKEIGIRKALGATPFSIVALIMQEAILITIFSGYLGLVIGVGLLELVNYAVIHFDIEMGFFRYPGIDFSTGVAATVVLVIAGSIAGLIPAVKAANISPIVAIREE